jgi:hypothetical protein
MHHTWQYNQKMNAVTQNNPISDQGLIISVYEDLNLVGQYSFSCKKVVIGQGEEADLHLKDPHLCDIQAIIHIQNNNIIISDRSKNTGVYLNGRPIKAAVLDPLDLIEIGKYSLKFQITDTEPKQNQNFQKVAVNQDHAEIRKHKLSLTEQVTPDSHHHRDGHKKILCCNKKRQAKSVQTLQKSPSQPKPKQSKNRRDSNLRADFLELSSYKEHKKATERRTQPTAITSSKKQMRDKPADGFFELLPYKGDKKATKQRTGPATITSSKKQKKDRPADDFFELLPYKGDKKASTQRTPSMPLTSSQQQKNDQYEDDFFKLPPYHSNNEPFSEDSQFSGPISAPQDKCKRFNLLFSGEFKTGQTLLQVKKNLNRRFGIDYRKLMFLIKGKPIILKRHLTYDKVMKLFKAFDSSGAICFIEPIENKSKAPLKKQHKNITASNHTKKISKNRKDKKLADSNKTQKWSGNRKDKKLADLDKKLTDLLDQPSRKICYCVNVPEKSSRPQKNKTTEALSTIRKSGIFSGSKKEAAINHLNSLN